MRYNANEIQAIIPHRQPFLLVDKIIDGELGVWARGLKAVTVNEYFFVGHFPNYYVMPGVLIVEALAQVGAVTILAQEEYRGRLAFFAGIKNFRFRKQVVPGDTLDLYCEMRRIRSGVGLAYGIAKVDGEVVGEGELTFAIGH